MRPLCFNKMNILAVTEKMENLCVLIFCKNFASFKFSYPKITESNSTNHHQKTLLTLNNFTQLFSQFSKLIFYKITFETLHCSLAQRVSKID